MYTALGKLSKLKYGETLDWVESANDTPPLLNLEVEVELPPNKILKKLNIKHIGTKPINMSDIMVYFAMFTTTLRKSYVFWALIR